jgi:hypothetical protein
MRTFGPKRGEVTVGWSKLYSEEFHNANSIYLLHKDYPVTVV